MKEWQVRITEKIVHTVEVEATDEEHAYTVAYRTITQGEPTEYDSESEGFITGGWSVARI